MCEPLKNKLVDKYPEDIFIEPTKEQWDKIHELCNKEIGKPFDGFAGSISRHVLRNCIEDVKSAVGGLKQELNDIMDSYLSIKTQKEYDKLKDKINNCINKWLEDVI